MRSSGQLRNDPEYGNWLAVGEALLFLSDGLRQYAEQEMKQLHSSITQSVGLTAKCNCTFIPGKKRNPHAKACAWAQELKKNHVFKNKTHIPWEQSDSSKWHDPVVGYWEIAKLFMSDLGSDAATVTDPDSTDIGPLLNLFRFCKHFSIQKTLLKAVSDRRNQWAHAPKRKLGNSDKKAAFQDIKLLMNDPELLSSKDVQACKSKINEVEAEDDSIAQNDELRILKEYQRIKESEDHEKKGKITFGLILLLVLMSIPWRSLSSTMYCCLMAILFIFSQVGDKSGIVLDEGKDLVRVQKILGQEHYKYLYEAYKIYTIETHDISQILHSISVWLLHALISCISPWRGTKSLD